MTARDAISPLRVSGGPVPQERVPGDMHLLEVLPRLLDSPGRELAVVTEEKDEGVIDQSSMLEALGRLIATRYDCCVVEFECAPGDYSASHVARAVEDSDVHLVDLLTTPAAEGKLKVTLRVRCEDPASTVNCLERYGYEVSAVYSHGSAEPTAALERLLGLQALLNV